MEASEIKELRARLGLTQESIAHQLGVSYQTVNRWENGLTKPSNMAIEKLKKLINKKVRAK